MSFHRILFSSLLLLLPASSALAATPCESLLQAKLPNGSITAAKAVTAGQFAPPEGAPPAAKSAASLELYKKLPAFCRVEATLRPSSDSEIRMELWLPSAGWNGKLVESGNSAFAGIEDYPTLANLVLKGYAGTTTDAGHVGNTGAFALGHPEKLVDFAHRSVHENAVAAKAVVAAFSGNQPQRAYFQGCSTGGRQAYAAAQRYPADFDGILSGSAAINFTHQRATELATNKFVHQNPATYLPKEKLELLHAAVVAACDGLDGVKDGLLENPQQCHFEPATLLCKEADAANCLTAPQIVLAHMIYTGLVNGKGQLLFPGNPYGSELDWGFEYDRSEPMSVGADGYRYVILQDATWDYLTLDVDRDVPFADQKVGALMNHSDPHIEPYLKRGGRILAYSGWGDSLNTPYNHIGYFNQVAGVMGGQAALDQQYRLFLIPGMGHCGGGDGATSFDLLGELDRWVTTSKAPASIPAARVREGKVDRTRPLCPYPQQAVYSGSGSADEAANFRCAVAK